MSPIVRGSDVQCQAKCLPLAGVWSADVLCNEAGPGSGRAQIHILRASSRLYSAELGIRAPE